MSLPARSDVPLEATWNLVPFYADRARWEQDFTDVERQVEQAAQFRGTVDRSARSLYDALSFSISLSQLVERVYTYAHLLSDTDTTNTDHLAMLERSLGLYTQVSTALSFVTPELLAIPEERLETFLRDKLLAPYERFIRETTRFRPHTRNAREEELLASATDVLGSFDKIFSQLNNADFDFGSVDEKPLSHGTFVAYLKHPDRTFRETVYRAYYNTYEKHKNSISAMLTASVKKNIYLARARHYPSAREMALFADNVSLAVYDNLIDTISSRLGALHRYYQIRKNALDNSELRIWDSYVPLVPDIKSTLPFPEACKLLLDALQPLGNEYREVLHRGLSSERWVDVYENRGKRSGAYSSGCYDSSPFILMNYKEDHLNDLFTLAHEAGHSMHSFFSNKRQSYQDHSYSIFVAEVASTFNEQLLLTHLRQVYANDRRMTLYLLNQQLDDIKATFFRQTMFAEFERSIHERAEKNLPLTIDTYTGIYRELLEKYFGPAVRIAEPDELEFMRIPHFYSSFYVYKYATGLSAAISLAQSVMQGAAGALERYLNFLHSGCSKQPLELLRDAGVDLSTSSPILATLDVFEKLVGEFEAELGR